MGVLYGSIVPLATLGAVISAIVIWVWVLQSRSLPLPPGPPVAGWLSGHLSILPSAKPWNRYTKWAQKYGPVLHLRAYNQHIVVLSSVDDCVELFDKRSNLYSDRPSYTIADLMGWDFNAAIMPYGRRWRRQRRLFQQMFRKAASLTYRPEQTRKVNDMLDGLLTTPEDFRDHVQTLSAAVVMSTAYGYDIKTKTDPFIRVGEDAMQRLVSAMIPGATLVNTVPVLQYLPPWFPGTGFHKLASETKELTTQMKEVPFKWTQDNMKAGTAANCMVAARLPFCKTKEDLVTLQEFAAMTYSAGADTTSSALNTFFYAMAAGVSPDAQGKAQEEIDRVVGRDRLPTYDDCLSLPYTEAILREVLRWKPVSPIGVPHRVTDDDVYKGYLIPKGALIISNIWGLSRDPSRYEDPETFNPDRFFDKDGNLNDDDSGYAFGFGRRVCPGRHMARATIWLSIATTLWAFNIGKAKDASGKEIPISGEYSDVIRILMHARLLQGHPTLRD
ncbi:hypothetical protein D9619_007172 [Psilocybe cf. subviscida]|uniref:Cytochrome P450 n=1 Tax=Psilocybe cf. subviscida TaxID=2480587 RepID=A0A8H5B2P7_9AGAR|nr:hypothetical protein D9619_007172 [Psilocybe cf. subviscida]